MTDASADNSFEYLYEDGGTLEAGPLAVHGLLYVYYEIQAGTRTSRAEEILARLPVAPDGWRLPIRLPTRGWAIGLAAAVIGLAFIYFRPVSLTTAVRADLREIGFALPILVAAQEIDPQDDAIVRQALESIASNRALLDQQLATGSLDPDPWWPWTQIYRRLRAIGRWDEALVEMNAFRKYAEEREAGPDRYTGYGMVLGDLADTYLTIGDYEQALEWRVQALDYARDYQEWFFRTGQAEDLSPLARSRAMANTLAPQYWGLSSLHAALGQVDQAWQELGEAEAVLVEYFRLECAQRGLNVSPDATLADLGRAVAGTDHAGLESMVVKVREHQYYRAVLHRLSRDVDSAEDALDSGSLIPDYPFADESRLDFNEPMERLCIAIARGDFVSALQHADEAAQNSGPREFDGYPPHPPIGIVARAELTFLKGVAKAGIDPRDPEAFRLIEAAIEAVEALNRSLPDSVGKTFTARSAQWRELAEALRASPEVEKE